MKYSKNFKPKIINLFKKGNSIINITLEFNIPKSTIYEWIKPYRTKKSNKQVQHDLNSY